MKKSLLSFLFSIPFFILSCEDISEEDLEIMRYIDSMNLAKATEDSIFYAKRDSIEKADTLNLNPIIFGDGEKIKIKTDTSKIIYSRNKKKEILNYQINQEKAKIKRINGITIQGPDSVYNKFVKNYANQKNN